MTMTRLQEIDHKHAQIRALLEQHKAPALWLRRTRNLAWITAGADASIPVETDYGMYSILITPEKRVVYTNNIELTRLKGEEHFEELGFEYVDFPWWQPGRNPDHAGQLTDEGAVEEALTALRSVLTEGEQERLRALGKDAAAALESTVRSIQPGMTEFEIAARLDAACKAFGGQATVNLIGTDERISQYRHPLPTQKKLDKYAMVVLCVRRGGLIVAGTRLGYIGKMPPEVAATAHRIAAIDATVIAASRPGRTLGAIFADLQAAYHAQGETDQWQLHHQGGPIAYQGRERIATPGDPTLVEAGMAFAWNPSIVGCKSEDTILVGAHGNEIVTAHSAAWPTIDVDLASETLRRAGILEL
jgi:antitoxin VapB